MRLTIIGKFPPIEGGVSSRTYRLAHALAKKGMEVTVLTNALCVEESGRMPFSLQNPEEKLAYEAPNLKVYSLKGPAPRHIPYSDAYLSRLVSLGLKVIEERGSDLIFSYYLEPYGTAGLFLKKLLGVPLVLQHAGSDIYRLVQSETLAHVLARTMREADGIFLGRRLQPLAEAIELSKKQVLPFPPLGIDTEEFSPDGPAFSYDKRDMQKQEGVPVVTYMGKAGKNKGILELCNALTGLPTPFRFQLLTGGELLPDIMQELSKNDVLSARTSFLGFLPPWEIPSVLRSTTILAHLEYNFSVPIHFPIQPLEAVATATPLLLSKEIYQKLKPLFPETSNLFTHVEDPSNTKVLRETLSRMLADTKRLKRDAHAIRGEFLKRSSWNAHVEGYVEVFERLKRKPFLFRL